MNNSVSVAVPHPKPARSLSNTSATTPRNPASTSSREVPRAPHLRDRSISPDPIARALYSLNGPKSTTSRPTSSDRKPGNFNIHRWSHSTASSVSAIDSDLVRKRTSSSGATRRSVIGMSGIASEPANRDMSRNGRNSPKRPSSKRAPAAAHLADGSRLHFHDSSNVNVVRDLSQNSGLGSMDHSTSAWEHRSGVNKFGEPVSGLSIQYTESTAPFQSLPNGATLPERRSSTGRPGHRDRSANRSKDNSKTSVTSGRSDQSRKGHRSPQQKDMLSKALAKANTAVLLDNAQDLTGAVEAYEEACRLLEQVMFRSTDPEDRRKLSAIQATYSSRIIELHEIDQTIDDMTDKALPDEPQSDEYDGQEEYYHDDSSFHSRTSKEAVRSVALPLRQESLLPQIFGGGSFLQDQANPATQIHLRQSQLNIPMDAQYMPSPLTPRYQLSQPGIEEAASEQPMLPPIQTVESTAGERATSWLDNIDGHSTRSTSRLSYQAFGRQNGQLVSDIEAEFDAAMNAAVEAAYEDESVQDGTLTELESVPEPDEGRMAKEKSSATLSSIPLQSHYVENEHLDAEDEEQLLDEMTREFGLDESAEKHQPKPSIPRQSDSSGFSSRTWGSSVASTTATSGTALSTLTEAAEPTMSMPPAPTQSPPKAPTRHSRDASQISIRNSVDKHVPIRDRRMSGQGATQLKIETFSRPVSLSQKPLPVPEPSLDAASTERPSDKNEDTLQLSSPFSGAALTPLASIYSGESTYGESPLTPARAQISGTEGIDNPLASPSRLASMMPPPPRPIVRKNISTSSLQKQSLSINTHPGEMIDSPDTAGSAIFSAEVRRRPSTSTPAVAIPGSSILTTTSMGGMHLFEDYAGDFQTPKAVELHPDEPAPLEPCPESFLLRPFWLMRSLYLALSHPRGGYITQKLFLPREIWRVRNVKIKALEDKISICDLLTAALQKLSKVDTFDAAAVLDEMQSFEAILDQARGTLSKKLGNEVGVAGTTSFFKSSPAADDTESSTPRSANSSAAKSFASWGRKLRSKSSSATLNTTAAATTSRDGSSQNFTMQSLPMTTLSSVQTSRSYGRHRNPPPTPSQLPYLVAPMAVYMSTLARLFEASQILDSIARQVEDPGLKYSSSTIVGLELSVRNAAEFFAFYVVRFVMNDLLLLTDKFLKKGSEWVMA